MAILANSRHEHFAQLVAKGDSASRAYVSAGFSKSGAAQSARRLLTNAQVCARIRELKTTISEALTEASIRDVNARIAGYEDRKHRLVSVMAARAADMADVPGGSTGLMVRDWRGKDAAQVVYKVDTGLLSAILALDEQAARELGQWMDKSELSVKDGDLAARLAAGRARLAKAKK